MHTMNNIQQRITMHVAGVDSGTELLLPGARAHVTQKYTNK